jgi:hypothetical protein
MTAPNPKYFPTAPPDRTYFGLPASSAAEFWDELEDALTPYHLTHQLKESVARELWHYVWGWSAHRAPHLQWPARDHPETHVLLDATADSPAAEHFAHAFRELLKSLESAQRWLCQINEGAQAQAQVASIEQARQQVSNKGCEVFVGRRATKRQKEKWAKLSKELGREIPLLTSDDLERKGEEFAAAERGLRLPLARFAEEHEGCLQLMIDDCNETLFDMEAWLETKSPRRPRGRPVHQRQMWLVQRTIAILDSDPQDIPLQPWNGGVLAQVLRIVLATGNRVLLCKRPEECEKRKYLKRDLKRWLATYHSQYRSLPGWPGWRPPSAEGT